MNGIVIIVAIILGLIAVLGLVAYLVYRNKLRRAKSIERGLKMVPLLIHLPPPSDDTESNGRDVREVMREKTAQAEVLYNLIAGTAQEGFKSRFYGQRHIGFEIIATDGLIHYYAAVPVGMVPVIQGAIISSYPGAIIEETEDHNVFSEKGKLFGTMGGELVLKADSAFPIATYAQLERDPMEALLSAMGGIEVGGGAAVQILLRPANKSWVKRAENLAKKKRKMRGTSLSFGAGDLAKAALKAPSERVQDKPELSSLEQAAIEAIENKTKQPGFEVMIRVLVSTDSVATSQGLLQKLATAFALFEQPGLNGFKYLPASNTQGLVTAFILRFFPPTMTGMVLNTEEIATLFHIPDSQFIPTTNLERQQGKQVDGPPTLSSQGLLLGYNEFRGVKKEIRLSKDDRRRHTYILGQTGTGKSVMLENLVKQDLASGNGFAFIDPHGETADKIMGMIPKERVEDVIYFNPADMSDPLGLNLFEFSDPMQKDFLIQESLNMLYKIYDPDHSGIIGPRFEQWYRNAALTLMADPNGATFIEIPKVFTDTEYLKNKFKYLKDSTVIEFWTKEMGQTSDYHKSEMLGFFVSKFGAFQQNEMMRNIIGQTKSGFNIREIMDKKKILIVNLSKGKIGELNSKLLGMMFVMKFQAAAMSRADMPEADRNDFCLYVDEFQNFSTDSFASILSEARKYRLNIIVANQFIGQLTPEIRDAVFGNVGTIISHRIGPEDAEFMTKQFAPVFDARDLVNIPNLNSVIKLLVGGLPSQPFSMKDLPFVTDINLELAAAIKELSAAKYGRPRAQVEAEITARLTNRPPAVAQVVDTIAPLPVATANVSSAPVVTPTTVDNIAPVLPPVPTIPAAPTSLPATTPTKDTLSFTDIKKPIGVQPTEDSMLQQASPVAPGTPTITPAPIVDGVVVNNDVQSELSNPTPLASSVAAKADLMTPPNAPTNSQADEKVVAVGIIDEAQREINSLLNISLLDEQERVIPSVVPEPFKPDAASVVEPLKPLEPNVSDGALDVMKPSSPVSLDTIPLTPAVLAPAVENKLVAKPMIHGPFIPRSSRNHTIDHLTQMKAVVVSSDLIQPTNNEDQVVTPVIDPNLAIESPQPVTAVEPEIVLPPVIEVASAALIASVAPVAEAVTSPQPTVTEPPVAEELPSVEEPLVAEVSTAVEEPEAEPAVAEAQVPEVENQTLATDQALEVASELPSAEPMAEVNNELPVEPTVEPAPVEASTEDSLNGAIVEAGSALIEADQPDTNGAILEMNQDESAVPTEERSESVPVAEPTVAGPAGVVSSEATSQALTQAATELTDGAQNSADNISAPSAPASSEVIPALAPGEIFVDENGVVHQG